VISGNVIGKWHGFERRWLGVFLMGLAHSVGRACVTNGTSGVEYGTGFSFLSKI
jgi:hypothetical protein